MEFGAISQVQVLSTTNSGLSPGHSWLLPSSPKPSPHVPQPLRFRWQGLRGARRVLASPGLHSPRSVHGHLLALSLALQAGCSVKDLSTTLSPHLVLTPPAPERTLLLIPLSPCHCTHILACQFLYYILVAYWQPVLLSSSLHDQGHISSFYWYLTQVLEHNKLLINILNLLLCISPKNIKSGELGKTDIILIFTNKQIVSQKILPHF